METRELLKKVKKIELRTRRKTDHLFSGNYHSAFKGRGMSFSEVREYVPGDDIRSIDWNVTAKTGKPHIKIFEEERELTVMLIVDQSASTHVGSSGAMRNDFITELAAVIAFSAQANNDKVGLIRFTDKVDEFIPPKKGRNQSLKIIRSLLSLEEFKSSNTGLKEALQMLNGVVRKHAVCFIISDFLVDDLDKEVKSTSRKHDLIGLWCVDPIEEAVSIKALAEWQDSETGQVIWTDMMDPKWQEQFDALQLERELHLKTLFNKNKASLLKLHTNSDYILELQNFFRRRAQRR